MGKRMYWEIATPACALVRNDMVIEIPAPIFLRMMDKG